VSDATAWAALLGLGAFHGANPGMGWLFAVALGLQERRSRAVLQALLPIGVGHALAIGAVVLAVALVRDVAPVAAVRWPVGVGLVAFGAYKFFRSRHPRWVGMRVGFKDLVAWSFLMASAHGAGFMLVPIVLGWAAGHAADAHEGHAGMAHAVQALPGAPGSEHAGHVARVGATPLLGLLATAVHTVGYLVVMGIIAIVVYERVGLGILRRAWFNLDAVWCVALVATGVVTLVA
jgi:hypothetical protein